jgi:hypothetical protein
LKLNIGSGGKPLEGYVNVDMQPMVHPDVVCDIGKKYWPFSDNSVDEVVAEHILEHLTTPELFHCMQEMYRVCKAGAEVKVRLPHPRADIFLGDPTHQRPVMPGTLIMFSQGQIKKFREQGIILTPFGEYIGVDFYLDPTIKYHFADGVDPTAPDIAWQMKHLNNIVQEFELTMRVVK